VQDSAIDKEAETYSEIEALLLGGMSPWRSAALPWRQASAGFAHRTLNDEEGENPLFLIILDQCLSTGKRLMDRPKPFSHVHLRRAPDRNSSVRHVAGRAVAIFDQSGVVRAKFRLRLRPGACHLDRASAFP
jgi:hypothetical protein